MDMRIIKLVLFAFALSVCAAAQIDTTAEHYYLYIYFIDGEVEQTLGARLAFSTDAVTWYKYNNGDPVIVPRVAKGEIPLMRDPNTWYESSTGIFHLIWTTAWNQDNIGYATSTDLINWSEPQVMIPVGEKIDGCQVCWAPEIYYDDLKDSLMIYWSTARGRGGKEAFYCMTKDFQNFTDPQVYFEPHDENGERYTVIDETILKVAEGRYFMFFKDEREAMEAGKLSKNIHYVIGATPQGPWEKGTWDDASLPISSPGNEGPTSIIIGDEVRVYYDPFNYRTSTDRSMVAKLADLQGEGYPDKSVWSKGPVMKTTDGDDFLPSHGSISEIPRAKVMRLLYGTTETQPEDTVRTYPLGKRNCGLGSGVGLAFFPPIAFKALSLRRRRKKKKAQSKREA